MLLALLAIALASIHLEKLSIAITKWRFPNEVFVNSGKVSTLQVWNGCYPLSVGKYVEDYRGLA